MIIKNSALLKIEEELIQEIDKLTKVYIEELKKLTSVYNLQSFAKIYKPMHDVNKDGYSIDNNIQENIEFVNDAIAHQLTSFVMVEKLQMKLMEDISFKIHKYQFELDGEKEIIQDSIDKKTPKNFWKKLQNLVLNKPVSKDLLEQKNLTDIKIKYVEEIYSKVRKINPKTAKNGKSDHLQLLKMSSFSEIKSEIKVRMNSSKVLSALADEMDTYRLAERYDKILERYPLKLEKLFTKHIGEDLSKQLTELKDKLDNQVLTLQQEANTLEHVLANISMIESDVIKGLLVKPIDFAKEKASGFKNNLKEIYKPDERNKKFGSMVMGAIILAGLGIAEVKVFNTLNITSKLDQKLISKTIEKLTDKEEGLISLLNMDIDPVEQNKKLDEKIQEIISEHQKQENDVVSKKTKKINNDYERS